MEAFSPARNPQVVHSRLAQGGVLLLHLKSGAYHELNPIGAAIWELLDGRRSASEISADLRPKVDDAPDDLDNIVRNFLLELRERDLIV